jgi:hypothetical protein
MLGMAGFLVIGLAIPQAFTRRGEGIALGLGYLLVVAVHGTLYLRVNRNILRVVPFSVVSALLVIAARGDPRGGRVRAVDRRARGAGAVAPDRQPAGPVRDPARALRGAARRADHRGVR